MVHTQEEAATLRTSVQAGKISQESVFYVIKYLYRIFKNYQQL
jgi:hypothetical protein